MFTIVQLFAFKDIFVKAHLVIHEFVIQREAPWAWASRVCEEQDVSENSRSLFLLGFPSHPWPEEHESPATSTTERHFGIAKHWQRSA